MRPVVLSLLLVAAAPRGVRASCADCCAPGGSCAQAYKQTPGVCCSRGAHAALPQCCPLGSRCAQCADGVMRCLAPYERLRCDADDVAVGAVLFAILGVVGVCTVAVWLLRRCPDGTDAAHDHRHHAPVPVGVPVQPAAATPGGVGVVPPQPRYDGGVGGVATGFLGGMLLGEMIAGVDGEGSPPCYNDTVGFEPDA